MKRLSTLVVLCLGIGMASSAVADKMFKGFPGRGGADDFPSRTLDCGGTYHHNGQMFIKKCYPVYESDQKPQSNHPSNSSILRDRN